MANKWDERKKAQEDEYFVKKERELLAKLKAKQEVETKTSLQKTCYMHCPKCGAPLKARSFQKIEIDQCTGCNGIYRVANTALWWPEPGRGSRSIRRL